jgi:outer membrane protein
MRKLCWLAAFAMAAHAETYTLTMKQALEQGLSHNPDVTLAKLDELKATQGIRVAQDPFYPHPGVGTGLAYNNGMPLSIEGSAPAVFQARVNEYLINRPQSYAIRQQRESARSAGFGTAQKRDEVAYQIAALYVDADRAGRLLETARTQIDSLQKVHDTVQARVTEGRELPTSVRQAQVNLSKARLRLSDLESDRDIAERNLAIALGYGPNDLVLPSAADRHPPAIPQDEASALQTALAASPELRRLESNMIAKGLEIKSAEARRLPQVDLVAQYALFAKYNNLDQYFAKYQPNNGQIGVSIQVPLFIGSGIKAATAQLDTDREHLRIETRSARDRIAMDIHKSYQSIHRAELVSQTVKDDLDLARDQLSVLLAQMNEGRATLADVEQARVNENEKWIAFYDAQFNQERARLDLLRQTGNLVASIQ